jgi:hypothetical protein
LLIAAGFRAMFSGISSFDYYCHMNRKIQLGWILGIGLCSGLSAQTINSGLPGSDAPCGQNVRMKDVLVLDLQPLRRQPEKAQEYVDERAGEFRLADTKPEVIKTRSRFSKDPDSVFRGARKLGVKNGCDLVLVLKTGPYLGRQRGRNPRIRDQGYAFVVMGQRTEGKS